MNTVKWIPTVKLKKRNKQERKEIVMQKEEVAKYSNQGQNENLSLAFDTEKDEELFSEILWKISRKILSYIIVK